MRRTVSKLLVPLLGAGCALSPSLVLAQTPSTSAGQAFPAKTIRIIAPFPPASVADVLARPIAQKMIETWGQPVIVDNRTGAAGNVGSELAAKSAPDGHTLLLGTIGTNAINAVLYAKMPYNARTDFAPITLVANAHLFLVMHPSVPVKTVKELIAFTKPRPNEILFSSSGSGSGQHLTMELLNRMGGIQLVHIPFKGTAASITDLVSGRISVSAASAISTLPHVRSGRLRALAVCSAKRSPSAPDLPTIAEAAIPGFAVDQWYALFAPAGTPRDIVQKLYGEVVKVTSNPESRTRLLAMGLDPVGSPPDEFAAYVKVETAKWGKLVREAGIRAN